MPLYQFGPMSLTGPDKSREVYRASVTRNLQEVIDDCWDELASKTPGKVTSIIPRKVFAGKAARRLADKIKRGSQTASSSYDEAVAQCRAKVDRIIKECRRVHQKYCDPQFDIDIDLNDDNRDCLDSLDNWIKDPENSIPTGKSIYKPLSVRRVTDIIDKPRFFIEGPKASEVLQGDAGDCWLLAALCTLSNIRGLIENVCVTHDVDIGVYGFVFHRNGEWFSEIIDDKLYLNKKDDNTDDSHINSGNLYFAQCGHPDETWLPLLEKAYAKAHGDYTSLDCGFMGEGIEDLTGGVTSELYTTDILDKEYFWKEELMKVNDTFLFGCCAGIWGHDRDESDGIMGGHAYSVMRAVEANGMRLVLLQNPWGNHEWKGAWSDGSKEWTADWINTLDHTFGDDGAFWISYDDLLRKYQSFERTRLFGPGWKMAANVWTSMTVPWTYEYNDTKFVFSLARDGPVVLVLSQLDDRYFRGLEGQYEFALGFRLHRLKSASGQEPNDTGKPRQSGRERTKSSATNDGELDDDDDDADYIVRCQSGYRMTRSVSAELNLEAGQYAVLVRIKATRNDGKLPAEEVVRRNISSRREKLIRTGMAYDIAHSKGRIVETPAEKEERAATTERRRNRKKAMLKKQVKDHRTIAHNEARWKLMKERKRRAKTKEKKKRHEDQEDLEKQQPKSEAREDTEEKAKGETEGKVEEVEEVEEVQEETDKKHTTADEASGSESLRAVEEAVSTEALAIRARASDYTSGVADAAPASSGDGPVVQGLDEATLETSSKDMSDSRDLSSFPDLSDMSDGEADFLLQDKEDGGRCVEDVIGHGRQMQEPRRNMGGHHHQPPPRARTQDELEPWNAIAVVGLRIYYEEVEGDNERMAAANEKARAAKAERAAKKVREPSKSESKSESKATKAKSKSRVASPKPKPSKEGKDAKDRAARGDHIVQLWIERPHPFMPVSSGSESESDPEYDSDSDKGMGGDGEDAREDDGAIGQGAENTLDIDDTLNGSL